jgi:hypothetical protein
MGARLLGLAGLLVLTGCGSGTVIGPDGDLLFPCGIGFGPRLLGVRWEVPGPEVLGVGSEARLVATVGQARDAETPTARCKSQAQDGTFRTVEWTAPLEGPVALALVSCPCRVVRSYEDRLSSSPNDWRRVVIAETIGPGEYVFTLTARAPGRAYVMVAGYPSAPCGGRPGDPIVACGPGSADTRYVTVE